MKEFTHDPPHGSLDLLAIFFVQMGQLIEQPVKLVLADTMPVLHQSGYDLTAGPAIIFRHEFGGLFIDQFAGLIDLSNPRFAIVLACFFQAVDVVQKDVVQAADFGVKITGRTQIEDERCPSWIGSSNSFEQCGINDRLIREVSDGDTGN